MTPLPASIASLLLALLLSPADGQLAGRVLEHRVGPGESLWSVGARHGASPAALAHDNGLQGGAWLRVGQRLRIDARHVVPEGPADGLLLNVPQRMLFLFGQGELLEVFPVAVGRPDWPTPIGDFHVDSLEIDKTWYVPASIQREMERCGQEPVTEVPPGPDNPLGRHWIGLSRRGYGIHGTIAPSSIHHFVTHGCVRMHPDDAAVLFPQLQLGDVVRIVYDPVLLAALPDGRVFLEVHPDAYGRSGDPLEAARLLAERTGVSARIDWERAQGVLQAQGGVARDVTRAPSTSEKEEGPG